jgi:hypothetical protein
MDVHAPHLQDIIMGEFFQMNMQALYGGLKGCDTVSTQANRN